MSHHWILETLDDLETYARANGLPRLADELQETRLLAMTEIASTAADAAGPADGEDGRGARSQTDLHAAAPRYETPPRGRH